MKIAVLIARILLGLLFLIFGLNDILGFLHMPPMAGQAGEFAGLLVSTKYMTFVGVLMTISGILLLVGRFVPLALTILAPILVNILLFHFLIAHGGAAMGLIATVLELFLMTVYRKSFYTLFHPAPEVY